VERRIDGNHRATRSIGAGYGEAFAANFLAKQVTPQIYDAILFVEKTTAAEVAKYAKQVIEKDKAARTRLYERLGLPKDKSVNPR
jgi:hypothetical protein